LTLGHRSSTIAIGADNSVRAVALATDNVFEVYAAPPLHGGSSMAKCQACGLCFVPIRVTHKFCSARCRQKAKSQRRNPEDRRSYDRRYYSQNRARAAKAMERWRTANRPANLKSQDAYRKANREIIRVRGTAYSQTENGKASRRARRQRRRALIRSASGSFTALDWQGLVAKSPHCHWCGRPFTARRRRTHDHVIPLSKGGTNSIENSVCACFKCNSRKQDKNFNPTTGQGILL
jgi:hypothetical protein